MGEALMISATTPVSSWVRLYLSASAMVSRATLLLRHSWAWVVQGEGDAADAVKVGGNLGLALGAGAGWGYWVRARVGDAVPGRLRLLADVVGDRPGGGDTGLDGGEVAAGECGVGQVGVGGVKGGGPHLA